MEDESECSENEPILMGAESECSENEPILMGAESEYSENGRNVMGAESEYSENEHLWMKDESGTASFEERNLEFENESWEDNKMRRIDYFGEFKIIACELCNRTFSRKLALEHHLARIHRLNESRINFLLEKVVHHSAQNYKCDACKRVFYKEEKLASHVCTPAVAVMCEICQQMFTSKTGLRRHLLAVHQLGSEKVASVMEELADYNSRFYKKFKITEDIVIASSDGRIITKEDGSEFKTIEGPRCIKCYKVFPDESAMDTHVCEPTIEIFCEICKYKAPTKYNLKRHFILKHKLSDYEINSAMEEFNCYNEKLQLRDLYSYSKLVKRRSSKRLVGAKSDNSYCTDFESRSIEEDTFSNSGTQHILPQEVKTCKMCYMTFETQSLFEEHDCASSVKQFKRNKIKIEVNNEHMRKLVCEICQCKFYLRIALKRHLLRKHNLDADVIEAFLERTSNDIDISDDNSDLDCEVSKEESDPKLISHVIEPINCEVCHQKLHSKKDLKGHLVNCFNMKESSLKSIFYESKDYYDKFYQRDRYQYELVVSSSDGRVVCKRKDSEFVSVPGPRCKKCNKAFIDEFRIVGHECAPEIKLTCRICDRYTAPTKHKVIRHLMNVHKQRKDDIHSMMKEFKGYSERLNLRVKKWPTDRPVKKETPTVFRENVGVQIENRSSHYFDEEEKSLLDNEKVMNEEKISSDSDCSYLFQTTVKFENLTEQSDLECDSGQAHRVHQISHTNSSRQSGDGDIIKEIICEICKRKFCRRTSLKKHLINIHELRMGELDYYLHRIAYENAANFKCDVCKKQFYKEKRLQSHNCSPAVAVVCELCQSTLTSKISLRRHLLISHKLEESKVNSVLEELSGFNSKFYKKLQIEGNKIAISSSDGRTIRKKNNFRFSLYTGSRCNVCYKALDKEYTHECATKIEIGCEICKYKAPSKYNLRRHLILIHKISESEAKLALQEFNRYNEKLELRQ